MKTTILRQIGCTLMVLLLTGLLPLSAQEEENFFTINGVVKDAQTQKTLAYANVTVPNTNVATVTNADGIFSLKIRKSASAKEINVSHLAYNNSSFEVSGSDMDNKVVSLVPNAKMLNELIVKPDYPLQLIELAISKINVNYSKSPNLFTGFYRETAQKGKRYIQVSEAIIDIYKDAYTQPITKDRVRIFKGRQLFSQKVSDTLAVKLRGGPTLASVLDVVKNPDVLLDKEMLSLYEYKLEEPVSINNRYQYVISFRPGKIVPFALYYGKYYIDRETLAFSRVEFSLDLSDINKAIEQILVKKPAGLKFKPTDFSFLVTYKLQDGVSYLSYMRTEAKFKCDWKRRLFSSKYDLVSEMVTTERQSKPVQSISYNESFKPDQFFSDKVSDFSDNNFWGGYNIIEPTESLENAMSKLKKRR